MTTLVCISLVAIISGTPAPVSTIPTAEACRTYCEGSSFPRHPLAPHECAVWDGLYCQCGPRDLQGACWSRPPVIPGSRLPAPEEIPCKISGVMGAVGEGPLGLVLLALVLLLRVRNGAVRGAR